MRQGIFIFLLACGLAAAHGQNAGMIKSEDIRRARENLQQHEWARKYLASLQARVAPWTQKITPEFLQTFIPETTPGETLITPCPACRSKGKPSLPHGDWEWSPQRPDELRCKVCAQVFPNDKFPEDIVVQTTWGRPQTFTFAGGEPFPMFSYAQGRPSFTGNIRAQKVKWMAKLARDLAEGYALTGEVKFAERAREILLRFAEVYPFWLVHVAYGEYADMDPVVAAEKITALPKPETVYPPNRPDGKLHTGYWSAGRAGAVGMEGIFVNDVANAYLLTVGALRPDGQPVYSADDRTIVENRLLRESTKLLVADKIINNKSMTNRSAAGLVGLAVGDPDLVRFGLEGFSKTVSEWFLPDGGTPESPAYAIMALSGVVDFAQAVRGYTDPEGYRDAQGKRYDAFDPYRDTPYGKIWEGMFRSLQGNLLYPPFADSYANSGLSTQFAEIMADNYPENPAYFALLHATLKGDWSKAYAPYAIYYADPDRESRPVPEFKLPDALFPSLKLGFLRTGTDGRESLLMLSASDWGAHHHKDGLNLSYWKNGRELWSDLGYLWDHPDQEKTVRTLAHNTVLIDGKDQTAAGRVGKVSTFLTTQNIKAMRAASNAYPAAKTYERAAVLVDHGNGRNYVVDVFWVEGGKTQDFVYHGPNSDWELELPPLPSPPPEKKRWGQLWERIRNWFSPPEEKKNPAPPVLAKTKEMALYDLANVQSVTNPDNAPYGIRWKLSETNTFTVWHVPTGGEQAFIGDGWGQRDSKNADRGKTLPYVVRRTEGSGRKTFVSVLEEYPTGQTFIQKITPLPAENPAVSGVVLQIDTTEGRDYVVVNFTPGETAVSTPDGLLETDASLAVLSTQEGRVRFHATDAGTVRLSTAK